MRNEIISINSSINTEVFKLDHIKKKGKVKKGGKCPAVMPPSLLYTLIMGLTG